jgi:hypothetical protein
MSPMTAVSHQVVGLIDIPADAAWSADAIVGECLGLLRRSRDRDRIVIAGRLPGCSPSELTPVAADFSQLRDDLDQLLETFLTNCPE